MSGAEWQSAMDKVLSALAGEGDPEGGVLPPCGYPNPVEEYGRALAQDYDVDIAVTVPMVMVAMSIAAQGGLMMFPRGAGSAPFDVPFVLQWVGIAPSGSRKSTVLRQVERRVEEAVFHHGLVHRQAWVAARQADGQSPPPGGWAVSDWEAVYSQAACPGTLVGTATPEGVRNGLRDNGGHQGIITAEPDVLREVGAYAKDDGSVKVYLEGWDQDSVRVLRATQSITVPHASLPMAVVLQPASFAQYTRSSALVDRGFLHRTLITEGTFVEEAEEEAVDWDDYVAVASSPSEVTGDVVEARLKALVERTNNWRCSQAAHTAWVMQRAAEGGVPMPARVRREELGLAPDARSAFANVQRMRRVMRDAVRQMEAEDPANAAVFMPLAERFTSHTLRIAMAVTLGQDAGATQVDGEVLTDVATRYMPWFIAHWTRTFARRAQEHADMTAQDAIRVNRDLKDVSLQGLIIGKIQTLTKSLPSGPMPGEAPWFKSSDVLVAVRKAMGREMQRSVTTKVLREALMTPCPELEVREVPTSGKGGRPGHEVRLTPYGISGMKK